MKGAGTETARSRSRRMVRAMFLGSALAVLMVVTSTGAADARPDSAPGAAPTKDRGGSVHSPANVWIRDNEADSGAEPSTGTTYWSPDIKVCLTVIECPTSQNPAVGVTNQVFVTLRRPGPGDGGGVVSGRVYLYYVEASVRSTWPGFWTSIGSASAVVPAVGSTTVAIPWHSVPGPGNFFLLARWVSNTEPTYPEGMDTAINVQYSNDIAWRNVQSEIVFMTLPPTITPFAISNPRPTAADTSPCRQSVNGAVVC